MVDRGRIDDQGQIDAAEVREAVQQACATGAGPLSSSTRLCDLDLTGLDLLACIATLEARYGIEFPADLVAAFETVDDLVHYTAVKRSQL